MNEEELEKDPYALFKSPKFLLFLLIAGFAVLLKGRMGDFVFDKALMYAFFAFMGLTALTLMWDSFKHHTPKLVSNPIATTTMGDWLSAGNYTVFRMGDVNVTYPGSREGFTFRGNDGTFIAPIDSLIKLGNNVAATVRMEQTKWDELPQIVQSVIQEHKLPEPYYMGYANEEQLMGTLPEAEVENPSTGEKISGPHVSYLISTFKEQNKLITMLIDVINRKRHLTEDEAEYLRRLGMTTGAWERIKGFVFEKKSEE